jgi:hypothetical protein
MRHGKGVTVSGFKQGRDSGEKSRRQGANFSLGHCCCADPKKHKCLREKHLAEARVK